MLDERVPAVEVAAVRLARDSAAETVEVALDGGVPLLEAALGEVARELAVEQPGPLLYIALKNRQHPLPDSAY